jgi:endo-1,4-beta-D-glucanase Y
MPSTENSSNSKVEAQGFAMITTAYMADKDAFDGLYSFYTSKLQGSSCGLMAWHTSCGGVSDSGAATDGDIDVASGLVVAHWQWPNDGYDDKALEVISNLEQMIADCNGVKAVYPGCSGGNKWGGCNETDISYYSPAFFRYFAELSGNDVWNQLADDTHTIRDAAANGQTGLVPDWQTVGGQAGAGGRAGHYGFDAIRTPFKQALDYLWNGNESAGAWCDKITGWAEGVGIDRIVDSYQLNGSAAGNNHNLAVVGSLAVCSLATNQQRADSFVAESVKLRDDFWYSGYLGNLYLLAMSGNMWNIDMMAPVDP